MVPRICTFEMASNDEVEQFTVASSAEDLRYMSRIGDVEDIEKILNRYMGESNELSKFLPAVLAASDSLSGNKALHFCAANGHLDVVRLLLSLKVDIDAINHSGSTALHYAALNGKLEIVRELIKNNAQPVIENKFGKTALDEARSCNRSDIADFLMEFVERAGSAPAMDNPDNKEAADTVEHGAKLESP